MNHVKVTTNNVPRNLVPIWELPEKVRKDFDYVENYDASYRFVQYKGAWYDVYDTQSIAVRKTNRPVGWDFVVDEGSPFCGWDGIVSDTFFSGVLFKLVDDERVIVGRYCV